MDTNIENKLQDIHDAIRDNNVSLDEIDRLFDVVKNLIEQIEVHCDTATYRNLRYKYHVSRASYLNSIRRFSEANEQEKLSGRYRDTEISTTEQVLNNTEREVDIVHDRYESKIKSIKEEIENVMENISILMEERHRDELFKLIKTLTSSEVTSLESCYQLRQNFNTLNSVLERISYETEMSKNDAASAMDSAVDFSNSIGTLKKLCDNFHAQNFLKFATHILSVVSFVDSKLFNDVPLTDRRIIKRYKELALLFHPDNFNCLEEVHIFVDLIQKVLDVKESKLTELNKKIIPLGKVKYYQNEGDNEREIAKDFSNRLKNFTTKNDKTKEKIQSLKTKHALVAFENYRSALYACGREIKIEMAVKLRKNMSICLIMAGREHLLEAELYTSGAYYIIVDKQPTLSQNNHEINELNQILNKIRNYKNNSVNESLMSNISSTNESSNSTINKDKCNETSLVPCFEELPLVVTDGISNTKRKNIKHEINKWLFHRCLVSADSRNVQHNTSLRNILLTEKKAGFGILTGIAQAVPYIPFYRSHTYRYGLLLFALGYTSHKMIQSANRLKQESMTRTSLNNIIQQAVKCFVCNDYERFLELLASKVKNEDPLLKFKDGTDYINVDSKSIINRLLQHDFRPDGIAYILNIIGEALLKNEVKVEETKTSLSSLIEKAKSIFIEIDKNEMLDITAKGFDAAVNKLQLNPSKYVQFPQEYLKDAEQATFFARLIEMKNIARINYAMCEIVIGYDDNIKLAKIALNKARSSLKAEHQFFGISKIRINALEDWMFAFGIYDQSDQTGEIFSLPENTEQQLQRTRLVQTREEFELVERLIVVDDQADMWLCLFQFLPRFTQLTRKEEFLDMVKQSYESDAKLKIEMDKRKISCDELCSFVSNNKNRFNRQHLCIFGYLLNVEFQCCSVKQKDLYETIFVANSEQLICPPGHKFDRVPIYLVVSDQNIVIGIFTTHDSAYVQYLHNLAKLETTAEKKAEFFWKIALCYKGSAEHCQAHGNHILSFSKWSEALRFYDKVCNISPSNPHALLGYASCLQKLHKYKRAEDFLLQNQTILQETGEFWKIFAIVQRHRFNKEAAKRSINAALQKLPDDPEAKREKKIIKGISIECCCSKSVYEHSPYKILSIDGGGVRGILPAYWLSEIEKLTKRPVSRLFNMMSGTSTGGIIVSALSIPFEQGEPQYLASDILELYKTRSNQLFTKNSYSLFWGTVNPVYSDEGRIKLFREYFKETRLKSALTDLLIPAVSMSMYNTHSFTKRHHGTCSFFDTVMATSSAPLFFQPYFMNDETYIDGGVQANNPTMLAHDEALKYVETNEDIYILSLGTGDYVPDPVNPEAYRSKLFWPKNFGKQVYKLVFDGPQNNQEHSMSARLGNQYHRFQVYFEEAIPFDDCRQENIELMIDSAAQYLEEVEAYDDRNRLGLVIQRLLD